LLSEASVINTNLEIESKVAQVRDHVGEEVASHTVLFTALDSAVLGSARVCSGV
jgi:hypothetical protein